MSLEVLKIPVVVNGSITDGVVLLCASVDDALRMMRKACQVHAVFLTLKFLCMLAFPTVVDLKRVVIACDNCQFSGVIKVQRSYGRLTVWWFEALKTCQPIHAWCHRNIDLLGRDESWI